MRQVFTSARLENVEGVARLLNEAGIETWVSEGRSYKGPRRRTFSYREGSEKATPAGVWVVKADDVTRARILLRDAGLLDSTRTDSYLPHAPGRPASPPRRGARRTRILALAAIGVAVVVTVNRGCSRPDAPPPDRSHIVPVDLSQA
ncbi:pathogenicity-like protein [Chiayiivirga flava]|uniref:DUF2007 domain-containing protein n=1 Tax=Chiayiivirga flava TaxID=659595 RepID=A0A7W8D7J0_9GAMM|nr:pathogenicity-like protein [Chiayiivirga flava]MBB5209022.1 hypothetical protein [Chiayiivirga flava]